MAKVVALRPVVGDGQWVLALVAVANAVLGVAVYLRWFAVLLARPASGRSAGAVLRQGAGRGGRSGREAGAARSDAAHPRSCGGAAPAPPSSCRHRPRPGLRLLG